MKDAEKLFNNATVILLLIFINKIILIKHRDNLFAWFIYLTIKNLS